MKIQDVFEALADPNRRAILELLKKNEMSVGEIARHFEITGASLSHHLNKLKAADLVISKRNGQTMIYAIHTTVFEDMSGLLIDLFSTRGKKNGSISKK
jgi:DNA-binding transcriptional ArsR family regulator